MPCDDKHLVGVRTVTSHVQSHPDSLHKTEKISILLNYIEPSILNHQVARNQVVVAKVRSGWGFKLEMTRFSSRSSRGPGETTRCAYVRHPRQKSTPPNPCFPRLNRSVFFSGLCPNGATIPTQPSCQLTLSLSTPKIRGPAISQTLRSTAPIAFKSPLSTYGHPNHLQHGWKVG